VKYDYFHATAGSVHDVPTNTDFAVRRSTGNVSVNAEYGSERNSDPISQCRAPSGACLP
jgi:hypothetical protein